MSPTLACRHEHLLVAEPRQPRPDTIAASQRGPGGRHLIGDAWRPVIPLAAAVLGYGIATALGGSGFIAAFVGGVLLGLLAGGKLAGMMGFTEQTGRRWTASRSWFSARRRTAPERTQVQVRAQVALTWRVWMASVRVQSSSRLSRTGGAGWRLRADRGGMPR